ncbi:hypothetical protein ACFVTC_02445 [Streptomyces sp. NPDC057950]
MGFRPAEFVQARWRAITGVRLIALIWAGARIGVLDEWQERAA